MAKIFEDDYSIKFVIIKVKQESVEDRGRYTATRHAWNMKLENIKQYPYVLSVTDSIVKAVYKVDEWRMAEDEPDRVEFVGSEVKDEAITKKFVGKMIPECYRQKGQANPVQYQKESSEEIKNEKCADSSKGVNEFDSTGFEHHCPRKMKKLKISIGNRSSARFVYYNCGTEGKLFDAATELMNNDADESEISDFVFGNDVPVEFSHFIMPTSDEEEEGPTSVVVLDEDDNVVFDGDVDTHYNYGVPGDPRKWSYDEDLNETFVRGCKDYADKYESIILGFIDSGDYTAEDLEDEDTLNDALRDEDEVNNVLFDDVENVDGDLLEKLYEDDMEKAETLQSDTLFAVNMIITYDTSYDGFIEIEDDDEFDPNLLRVSCWDNDGFLNETEGLRNCILPIIQYDNKFYKLEVTEWEEHYSSWAIRNISGDEPMGI